MNWRVHNNQQWDDVSTHWPIKDQQSIPHQCHPEIRSEFSLIQTKKRKTNSRRSVVHRAQLAPVRFILPVFLCGAICSITCLLMWGMVKSTEIDASSRLVFASSRPSEAKKTSNYAYVRSIFIFHRRTTRLLLMLLLLWMGSTEGADGEWVGMYALEKLYGTLWAGTCMFAHTPALAGNENTDWPAGPCVLRPKHRPPPWTRGVTFGDSSDLARNVCMSTTARRVETIRIRRSGFMFVDWASL